ncbi:hypothetical protein J5X84_20250 [Streptosporangiaceae bacterium NEAU-GS5]|nr:hypothetical protein [Streptosporangiaceae bacterium NEAU-GS5]
MQFLNELTDSGDARTQAVVDLLSRLVYIRAEAEAYLNDVGLPPAEYADRSVKLTWLEAVPDAAGKGLLEQLVRNISRDKPAFAAQLHNRMREISRPGNATRHWYQHNDPYMSQFVGPRASRAMIDRAGLRNGLRALADEDYRILVIRGPEKSGKSHSWFLVEHLRDAGELIGAHRFARVTTHTWMGSVTGVDLGLSIARKLLGLDIGLANSGEQPVTLVRKILDILVGEYPQDGVTRWIVLDGLDRPGVDDSAHDLAKRLIQLVDEGELPRTRLIVTGLDMTGLNVGPSVKQEEIPQIDLALVRTFLSDVAVHLGLDVTPAELDLLATTTLAADPGPPLMNQIEANVIELVRTHWVTKV